MFISLDLNRKNINRAISDNMVRLSIQSWSKGANIETVVERAEWVVIIITPQNHGANASLEMNTNDFNYGQTVSFPGSSFRNMRGLTRLLDLSRFVPLCRTSQWLDQ